MPITGAAPGVSLPYYHWGGLFFDDYALAKTLTLPSNCHLGNPITFHDEDGNDYQVPTGKVFIAGVAVYYIESANPGRVGESATADTTPTKYRLILAEVQDRWHWTEVFAIFTAGTYVTGDTTADYPLYEMYTPTTLYGIEISL